jgi:hypothetical protein
MSLLLSQSLGFNVVLWGTGVIESSWIFIRHYLRKADSSPMCPETQPSTATPPKIT